MIEKEFEDILARYPEIIEEGLTLEGRQVSAQRLRVDLLFKDRHGQRLIVELKKGAINREHLGQLMDYEGYLLDQDDPTVRVMLIGNRVPPNMRRSLEHHGFEWREFTISHLQRFLTEYGDTEYLNYLTEEAGVQPEHKPSAPAKPQPRPHAGQPTITDKLYELFATDHIGQILTSKEIIDLLIAAFPETNRSSVIPSDYCYNITNAGIKFNHHLFEYLGTNQYKVLGKNYPYVGPIFWKNRKVGEWPPDGTGPILHEK